LGSLFENVADLAPGQKQHWDDKKGSGQPKIAGDG